MWLKLKGKGSVRCTQNPNCRGQLSSRNKSKGDNCARCGWWWRSSWYDKYNGKIKVVKVKFLQDIMVEKGVDE